MPGIGPGAANRGGLHQPVSRLFSTHGCEHYRRRVDRWTAGSCGGHRARIGVQRRKCAPVQRADSPEEYEDASAVDPAQGRFALADGASESSFAAAWARLLVSGFVACPVPWTRRWTQWLPPLQAEWAADVDGRPQPIWVKSPATWIPSPSFSAHSSGFRGRCRVSATPLDEKKQHVANLHGRLPGERLENR